MPPLLEPEEWRPEGIATLEPAALRVVQSSKNTLVVAGPGAGKTELLAQRTSYLLQTGLCPFPKRILAISFKRDAAKNLKERIDLRCGKDLSRRFDSFTFDAFAKSLFDRFRNALPTEFTVSSDYNINFEIARRVDHWLEVLVSRNVGLSLANVKSIRADHFYRHDFLGHALSAMPKASSIETIAALELWNELLSRSTPAQVDFPMIGRLAELILVTNPALLTALRTTYGFLFLDEFQDTTGVQYDLTKTAFRESQIVVTAVGDDKQRIMAWAGALGTIFRDFKQDFAATKETLLLNHRSAPELVRIQTHLVQMLDPQAPKPEASKVDLKGECRVAVFDDHNDEAQWLATAIADWIKTEGIAPEDICILTRNRPDHYTAFVSKALEQKGIQSRVQTELQDLVTEPLVIMIAALFRVAVADRAQKAWSTAIEMYFDVNGVDKNDARSRQRESELAAFLKDCAEEAKQAASARDIQDLVTNLMGFIGESRFRNAFGQYRQGTWYDEVKSKCANYLAECRTRTADWIQAIDLFEGIGCVPIMTIHKSKGLEYHTVIFVGLEDSALWGFRDSPDEEKRTFFVAFSRAIKRVVFTFCQVRERQGRGAEGQSRKSIGIFYKVLTEAGVKEERIRYAEEGDYVNLRAKPARDLRVKTSHF